MNTLLIREIQAEDQSSFLAMTNYSQILHHPWVFPPLSVAEFEAYFQRSQQPNQKSYILILENNIIGVYNLSEIVRGFFQNAYLGFYVAKDYDGKGWMSQGLKLLLHKAFAELELHRIEANIQPQNAPSIALVKKNGFRLEGFSQRYLKINNIWCDHERWAITKEEWL